MANHAARVNGRGGRPGVVAGRNKIMRRARALALHTAWAWSRRRFGHHRCRARTEVCERCGDVGDGCRIVDEQGKVDGGVAQRRRGGPIGWWWRTRCGRPDEEESKPYDRESHEHCQE